MVREFISAERWGVIWRPESFWIGAHYSPYNKRLCVNILPTLTVWFIKEGGTPPGSCKI